MGGGYVQREAERPTNGRLSVFRPPPVDSILTSGTLDGESQDSAANFHEVPEHSFMVATRLPWVGFSWVGFSLGFSLVATRLPWVGFYLGFSFEGSS